MIDECVCRSIWKAYKRRKLERPSLPAWRNFPQDGVRWYFCRLFDLSEFLDLNGNSLHFFISPLWRAFSEKVFRNCHSNDGRSKQYTRTTTPTTVRLELDARPHEPISIPPFKPPTVPIQPQIADKEKISDLNVLGCSKSSHRCITLNFCNKQ